MKSINHYYTNKSGTKVAQTRGGSYPDNVAKATGWTRVYAKDARRFASHGVIYDMRVIHTKRGSRIELV